MLRTLVLCSQAFRKSLLINRTLRPSSHTPPPFCPSSPTSLRPYVPPALTTPLSPSFPHSFAVFLSSLTYCNVLYLFVAVLYSILIFVLYLPIEYILQCKNPSLPPSCSSRFPRAFHRVHTCTDRRSREGFCASIMGRPCKISLL